MTPEQFHLAQHGRAISAEDELLLNLVRPLADRMCPICGYRGAFRATGRPARLDAQCPNCGSLERHRLFWLWLMRLSEPLPSPILHFAAEPFLRKHLSTRYGEHYRTADLFQQDVDLQLDLHDIDLPDRSVGTILASHVLEHVDDKKALAELYRILAPGGLLLCAVPIVETWANSYENAAITTPLERELHFGQSDHVRYYGRDLRERIATAGFEAVEEITGSPEECAEYGLMRGEILFVYRRSTA